MRFPFWRRSRQEELAEEIENHLRMAARERQERGENPRRAEQSARREFGNTGLVREVMRDQWGWRWLETLFQDLRYALRMLRKSPGFTAVAVLTLALGIGANTAIFSVVNSVLFEPLPYPHPQQLVALHQTAPGAAGLASFSEGLPLSPSVYFTYAEQNRTFQSLGVWASGAASVTGLGNPEQVRAVYVSDGLLQALDVPPVVGRWLSAADQIPNGAQTAMLSYGYWQRRFGGNPSVIGTDIIVDSRPRQIVGVMPRGFQIVDANPDLILPFAFDRGKLILAGFGSNGIARLRPGATIAQANADVARMIPIWMRSWSNGPGSNPLAYERWRITPAIRPLKQEVVGSVATALWVVMATLGIVMLIACANVANLLLVKVEARQQELAIRAVLGAPKSRIVRGLLFECLILGLMGGALGLVLAGVGLRLLLATGPASLPR